VLLTAMDRAVDRSVVDCLVLKASKVVMAAIGDGRLLIRAAPVDEEVQGAIVEFRPGWIRSDEVRLAVLTIAESAAEVWYDDGQFCCRIK
jgi:hypothetical protein